MKKIAPILGIILFMAILVLSLLKIRGGKGDETKKPQTSEQLNRRALQLARKGELDSAIVVWKELVEIYPDYPEGYNNLGAALNNVQEPEQALGYLRRAIEIRPKNASSYFNLARSFFQLKEYDSALVYLDEGMHYDSLDVEAWLLKGDCLDRKGDYQASEKCYRKADTLAPDNFKAKYSLGISLTSQGEYQQAVKFLREGVKLKPENAACWNNLGVALSALKRYTEGIIAFRKAVNLKSDYSTAWVNMGLCYENLGYHKQASQAIANYLKYAPEEASDREFMSQKVAELKTMSNEPDTVLPDSLLSLPQPQ